MDPRIILDPLDPFGILIQEKGDSFQILGFANSIFPLEIDYIDTLLHPNAQGISIDLNQSNSMFKSMGINKQLLHSWNF